MRSWGIGYRHSSFRLLTLPAIQRTSSTTETRTTSTSQTKTQTYPQTGIPTWNPANTIIDPGCRYLPVPFIIPGHGYNQANVFNIELIACVSSTAYDATFIAAAQKWMSIVSGDINDWANYGTLDCGYRGRYGHPDCFLQLR